MHWDISKSRKIWNQSLQSRYTCCDDIENGCIQKEKKMGITMSPNTEANKIYFLAPAPKKFNGVGGAGH